MCSKILWFTNAGVLLPSLRIFIMAVAVAGTAAGFVRVSTVVAGLASGGAAQVDPTT